MMKNQQYDRRVGATHHMITAALSFALWAVLPGLGGCTPRSPATVSASQESPEPVMLAITGYNYTNRHIGSFSVDGTGGGNLYVSTPISGGGGTVCCALYTPGNFERTVTVRWQSGGCYYHTISGTSGKVFDNLHPYHKEQQVVVDSAIPANPKVLEVHFYPDGSIKATITSSESPPRLRLDGAREDKSVYPRCPNDQKPAK